jgi:hypothetical protein
MNPGTDWLDFTLLAAVLLAVAHLFGPSLRQGMRQHSDLATSFGGGLAVAYVFLQLFPEIEASHEWFGDQIHVVTLVSFLVFYALELRLLLRSERRSMALQPTPDLGDHAAAHHHPTAVFWWHIAVGWFYTFMVVFALPHEVSADFELTVLTALAIGMHLIYKDYVLRSHHSSAFEYKGQFALAFAPLAGWLAHTLITPPEIVLDLFIAVLAGFLMQNVFRDELPSAHTVRLSWLFGGAGAFTALALALG